MNAFLVEDFLHFFYDSLVVIHALEFYVDSAYEFPADQLPDVQLVDFKNPLDLGKDQKIFNDNLGGFLRNDVLFHFLALLKHFLDKIFTVYIFNL